VEPLWDNNAPIYRQMRDRLIAMILEGKLREGDSLPSVRNVAAHYHINPLTVLKSFQQLVDDGLVEKRRGKGMFVCTGAKAALLTDQRAHFLSQEWPRICASCARLGIDIHELPNASTPLVHNSNG
jgi:GntR family transcriptional regulator